MSATYHGNTAPRITGRKLQRTDTGLTGTVTVEGKLSDLETQAGRAPAAGAGGYKVGSSLSVLGTSLKISQTELQSAPGGMGKLIVTATAGETQSGGGSGGGEVTPAYHMELDFSTVTKRLSEHPAFANLDNDDWGEIAKWEALKGQEKFLGKWAAFNYPTDSALDKAAGPDPADDEDWSTLDATEQAYAELVMKGVQEYFVQVPVVRRTSQAALNDTQTVSRCGQREDPPQFASLAAAWLKTADRWSRDSKHGSWQHHEEWSGFDSLDETLYPTGSSST